MFYILFHHLYCYFNLFPYTGYVSVMSGFFFLFSFPNNWRNLFLEVFSLRKQVERRLTSENRKCNVFSRQNNKKNNEFLTFFFVNKSDVWISNLEKKKNTQRCDTKIMKLFCSNNYYYLYFIPKKSRTTQKKTQKISHFYMSLGILSGIMENRAVQVRSILLQHYSILFSPKIYGN